MMPIDVQQSASSDRMWLRDEDRLAHPLQLFEQGLHLDAGPRIEAARRLVEDQHRRIVDQRLGHAQPLLHAARQAVDIVVALVPQVEQLQHVVDDLLPLALADLVGHREEIEKLPDLHAVIHAEIVGHVAHALPHRHRVLRHAVAVDDSLAAAGLQQRGQKADRRALARAVGADEAEHLARADLEVQRLDRAEVAVVFAEVDQFDHGTGSGFRVQELGRLTGWLDR